MASMRPRALRSDDQRSPPEEMGARFGRDLSRLMFGHMMRLMTKFAKGLSFFLFVARGFPQFAMTVSG